MFTKLSALLLALPLVSATITIQTPSGWTTGSPETLHWSAATTDPGTFSVELVNTKFNNEYAIANSVITATGTLSFTLPSVPVGDGYTINFIATNDVNNIYASSGSFSIGADTTSSGTASSTTTTGTDTSTGTSTTASTSSATVTNPLTTATGSTAKTPAATGTGTAASSTPSTFNNSNGAGSFKFAGVAPAAALVLSAVAGAAMVF